MNRVEGLLLQGRRLLIVEDEYLIAIDLAGGLEEIGAEIVGMAGSVEEALALVQTVGTRLEAAVLDVNLGRDRVYPVADALLARDIPFVFATGYDRWVMPEAYAAIPRCEKPVRVAALARLLAAQMANRADG